MDNQEDVIGEVNRLRSMLLSLENLRKSSMYMHNRLVPAFHEFAKEVVNSSIDAQSRFPNNQEIDRWIGKIRDYADQHEVQWNS